MRYLTVLLLLAGCATPEERADRMISSFGPTCERLGYQQGSDKYRDCIVQMHSADQQRRSGASTAAAIRSRQ
jgi:hypothetical protein